MILRSLANADTGFSSSSFANQAGAQVSDIFEVDSWVGNANPPSSTDA